MFYIYKLTSPEGKVYVGQTSTALNRRWQNGYGYKNNPKLFNDILNFGWVNFQHEVLETVETKEEATKKEREYILKFNSNICGYNKHTNYSSQKEEVVKKHKYVRCIETGELYETLERAAASVNRCSSAVWHAIKHNTPCGNRHWERVELTEAEYYSAIN